MTHLSDAPPSRRRWRLPTRELAIGRVPLVMGIVNVTPDSFSDGGQFHDVARAVDHALQLVADGADILDIGGESTRPYSQPVGADEERARVVPVIEILSKQVDIPISIDTSKASVARAAFQAGAEIINDVTGLEGDRHMLDVALESGAGVCAMHMQGTPQTMQDAPHYEDVVAEIHQYLQQRREALVSAGVDLDRICLDPGIGFGKSHTHNLELLEHCDRFLDLDCPILIGHSRKGFLKHLMGRESGNRDVATLAVSLRLAQQGMHVLRVHDVAGTVVGLQTLAGINGLECGSQDFGKKLGQSRNPG